MNNTRTRIVVLLAICILAIGGAVAYITMSLAHQTADRAKVAPAPQTNLASVTSGPHIVFRNTNKRSDYGQVAVVSLANPAGPRAITVAACDRVYATEQRYLCLSSSAGVVTTYSAHVLDSAFEEEQTLPLTGVPSRARLSRDGSLAATTSFTAGDSYAATSFSTRTVITKIGGASYGSLENFTLIHAGERIAPIDRNYWGVTFAADDDTFYATVQWSKHTWLVKGSLSRHLVVTLRQDAECPSLSPDGQHIVYKQRGNLPPGQWRLVRYDVATGQVTQLAETHSVDDQVEWLDDSHVIYGIPRTGTQAGTDDVWELPIDGSGLPKLLIPEAWSPAVVR
jgi:hypothetical protein